MNIRIRRHGLLTHEFVQFFLHSFSLWDDSQGSVCCIPTIHGKKVPSTLVSQWDKGLYRQLLLHTSYTKNYNLSVSFVRKRTYRTPRNCACFEALFSRSFHCKISVSLRILLANLEGSLRPSRLAMRGKWTRSTPIPRMVIQVGKVTAARFRYASERSWTVVLLITFR